MPVNIQSPLARKAGAIAFLLLIFSLTLWVLSPFWAALAWAGVLAYVTWPLYVRLSLHWRGRVTLAALGMTLMVALVLLVPMVLVLYTLTIDAFRKALGLEPGDDLVVSVDGGTAKNPSIPPEANVPAFDDGLGLRRYETIKPQRGVLTFWADPDLVRQITRAGERTRVPIHYDVRFNVYTDAAGSSESWMDIKCAALGTPRRYGHAPLEIVHLDTLGKAVAVLDDFLRTEDGKK